MQLKDSTSRGGDELLRGSGAERSTFAIVLMRWQARSWFPADPLAVAMVDFYAIKRNLSRYSFVVSADDVAPGRTTKGYCR
jgi:hypothetical protein